MPVNTDGGCLANGEPIGASGLRQVYEYVLQLRGDAGARQVPRTTRGPDRLHPRLRRAGHQRLHRAVAVSGVASPTDPRATSSGAAPAETTPVEVAPVRPGEDLDWVSLEAYLRMRLPELSGDLRVLQFPNGSANLTYLVAIGNRQLVVRRPPFGQLAPGAHDMHREYRTLSRLWQRLRQGASRPVVLRRP